MKKTPLNWANGITLGRLLCTPVFIGVMLKHRQAWLDGAEGSELAFYRWLALGVFLVAAFSDALDGFVARHFKQRTELGTILDPLADKLLLDAAILAMSLPVGLGDLRFPFWFPIAVLTRDFGISVGTLVVVMLRGKIAIKPSFTGKATTFCQMCCVGVTLMGMAPGVLKVTLYVATALTAVTCVPYVYRGLQMVHDEKGET